MPDLIFTSASQCRRAHGDVTDQTSSLCLCDQTRHYLILSVADLEHDLVLCKAESSCSDTTAARPRAHIDGAMRFAHPGIQLHTIIADV